ncbi:MAG: 7-cyano-7-deazaguanine synthase QueC [Legionellaceae bacterium]|nr:7-cyano-7-deazaguanine synthase QueC [Legionellaceae bacterium]
MTKKAVILLSGGLDSTTCLLYAQSKKMACYTLSFDYGQKHRAELDAAERIANHYQVEEHKIINLASIGQLGGSALTDTQHDVPNHVESNTIPITYVPARNTIMLSIALGWAEILNADHIFIGVSAIDYSSYPDCRPAYIDAFRSMANLATKRGIEGNPITIETPLIGLSKAQTIELGISLGLDYAQTISCYRATSEGLACGECDSCYLRKKGFKEANLVDPTRYLI